MKLENLDYPEDWQIKPIREVFSFTKKPRGLSIPSDGLIPFLPMQAIPIGRVRVSAFEERLGASLTSGTYIENGDLLVAKITPSFENGKQAIVDWKKPFGFATTEVIPLQEIEGVSDNCFLFHLLLHPAIRSDLAGKMDGTTGRQRLSKEVFGSRLIPLPPITEQRKIAAVLGLVQWAQVQQEGLIALTTELRKAFLHQIFTQGLRGEPQKQTEIGPVPQSWEVVTLSDVVKLQSGGTPTRAKPEYWTAGDIPWVKTGEIDYRVIRTTEERITREGLANSAAKVFPKGTLLMAMYGQGVTRGRVGLLGIDAATNQACAAITPRDEQRVSTQFIYHYLEFHYEDLRQMGHGANQRNLNAALIKGFRLSFPKPDEQAQIVEALGILNAKVMLHQSKHAALTALFRTLLHQLMTAQIRVHNLELPELA